MLSTRAQLLTLALILGVVTSLAASAQDSGSRGFKMYNGVTLEGDKKQLAKPVTVQLKAAALCQRKTAGGYKDVARCDKARLKEGDRLKLSIQATAPAFLYIFSQNDTGQFQMLFPQPKQDNALKAGQRYLFPEASIGWIELDAMSGTTDRLTVIASPYQIKELEAMRGLNTTSLKDSDAKGGEVVNALASATRGFKMAKPMDIEAEKDTTVQTTEVTIKNEDVASAQFSIVRP